MIGILLTVLLLVLVSADSMHREVAYTSTINRDAHATHRSRLERMIREHTPTASNPTGMSSKDRSDSSDDVSNDEDNVPYRRIYVNPHTRLPYTIADFSWIMSDMLSPFPPAELPRLPPAPPLKNLCHDYVRQRKCNPKPDLKIPSCPHHIDGNNTFSFAIISDSGLADNRCEENVSRLLQAALDGKTDPSSPKTMSEDISSSPLSSPVPPPSLFMLGGDNAYWQGTCSEHLSAFSGAPVLHRAFAFDTARAQCVEPTVLRKPWTAETSVAAYMASAVTEDHADTDNSDGFASFHSATGYGVSAYRGMAAQAAVVPGRGMHVPAVFRDQGLPSPYVADTSLPVAAQWLQRVEYIRTVLTRATIPSTRVYAAAEDADATQEDPAAAVRFCCYSDALAVEYITWQFPPVATLDAVLAFDLSQQGTAGNEGLLSGYDLVHGYGNATGPWLDVDAQGVVQAVHGLPREAVGLGVYAFAPEEDVAPVNNPALLGVLARARARTALSVHDLNTNARAKKQSRRHPWLMPTSGNHDYDILYRVAGRLPYHQYFPHLDLMPPGGALSNGMFYSIVLGRAVDDDAPLLEIFVINSNLGHQHHRADTLAFNVQASWLRHALHNSRARIKAVVLHHPPHTTVNHDYNAQWANLPYKEWGAALVISGHQHAYERLQLPPHMALFSPLAHDTEQTPVSPIFPNPTPAPHSAVYLLNGLGGHHWVYDIEGCDAHPASLRRYNAAHGALIGVLRYKDTIGSSDSPYNLHARQRVELPQDRLVDVADTANGGLLIDDVQYRGGHVAMEGTEEVELSMCFVSTENGGTLVDHVSIFS